MPALHAQRIGLNAAQRSYLGTRAVWTCVLMSPLTLVATAACSNVVPDWCTAPEGADVRVAHRPLRWSGPPALTEEWRVVGSDAGRELMTPSSAAVEASTGRIAIADIGLKEVVVIGPDGSWQGRWGRAGQGPGEMMAPFAVAWRADGSLIVYDPATSRLAVFDSAGNPLDDVPVARALTAALRGSARSIQLDGSGLFLAEPGAGAPDGDDERRIHAILRGGGSLASVDTVLRASVPVVDFGFAAMTAAGWQVPLGAMHGDSILALAGDRPEYMVRVYRNGRPSHVICRDVDPLPFDAAEVEPQQRDVPEAVTQAMAAAARPGTPARIGRLYIDVDGRLWVQRDRPRALAGMDFVLGRPGALFDVFDAGGVYLGAVRMPAGVRLLGAARDLLYGLETGELGELSVVGLRID